MKYLDTIDLPGVNGHRRDSALAWLRRHLPEATELTIQTGYLTRDGLMGIHDRLVDLVARGGRIRLVIGDREDQADPDDVAVLLSLAPHSAPDLVQVGSVTVSPGMFHAKTIHLVMRDGSQRALVGSGNLTGPGLRTNAEAWVELGPGDEPQTLEAVRASTLAWLASPTTKRITLGSLSDLLPEAHRTSALADILEASIDEIEGAVGGSPLTRVASGFEDLDRLLAGGFLPGWFVVVAGRPGIGKSTLLNDIFRAAAIQQQIPSALFSLEMEKTAITNRILAAEARIPLQNLLKGAMREEDWTRLARTMAGLGEAPLYINTRPGLTIPALRRELERLVAQGVRLVGVDYLQLMPGTRRQDNRQLEVSEISRALKNLARDFKVVLIAASALNRGNEQRTDKRPNLSDMRDSGQIEADADLVLLLHREDYYEKETPRAGEADIIVGKNRHGPTDTITVAFQGHYARFVDMA